MQVFLGELVAVAEGRTYFESEALLNTVRGNPVHVFFTMVLSGPDQSYDRVLFSAFNITARKRAEEALQEADRRKDEFLATLAHELRN
jgi:signal transduction histidine kinase